VVVSWDWVGAPAGVAMEDLPDLLGNPASAQVGHPGRYTIVARTIRVNGSSSRAP
jgi:hypothetical protein